MRDNERRGSVQGDGEMEGLTQEVGGDVVDDGCTRAGLGED